MNTTNYIDENSPFYNKQIENIENLNDDTTLSLSGFDIDKFTKVNDTTYNVKVSFTFGVKKSDKPVSSEELYKSNYEVKYKNDGWYITKKF